MVKAPVNANTSIKHRLSDVEAKAIATTERTTKFFNQLEELGELNELVEARLMSRIAKVEHQLKELEERQEGNEGSRATSLLNIIERIAKLELHRVTTSLFKFEVGQRIVKVKGYSLSGEVKARWLTDNNEPRYVVDHKPLVPGMCHIYNEEQLREDKPT